MSWSKLEIFVLAAGALLAAGGKALEAPTIVSFATGLITLDIALVGLEGIVTRTMKWGITQHYSETYQGIAAVSLGAIMLITGLGLSAMVAAQALNREQALLEMVFGRPGPLLLLIGALTALRGIAGVVGAIEWNASISSRIGAVFERAGSSVLAILGCACMVLGGLDVIAPKMFQGAISTAWQQVLSLSGIH